MTRKGPQIRSQKAKKKMSSLGGTWTADKARVRSAAVLDYAYGLCGPMGERIRTISGRGGSPKYLKRDNKTTKKKRVRKLIDSLFPGQCIGYFVSAYGQILQRLFHPSVYSYHKPRASPVDGPINCLCTPNMAKHRSLSRAFHPYVLRRNPLGSRLQRP